MFLVKLLPPWHTNIGKRLVKTPKVLLADSGLAAHLMGIDGARLAHDRGLLGGLLESFVAMELAKQAAWSEDAPAMYHFRTDEGDEVGLVHERRSGAVVGIEVKSGATVTAADFKGFRARGGQDRAHQHDHRLDHARERLRPAPGAGQAHPAQARLPAGPAGEATQTVLEQAALSSAKWPAA